jgi:hypothetical protein
MGRRGVNSSFKWFLPVFAKRRGRGEGIRAVWYPVAKFVVPDLGDKVDSEIGLSYRPASLCSLAGRYDNPRLWMKREISKSRPELRPRPRHWRGFFLGFMFEPRNRWELSNFAQTWSRSRRKDFSSVRDPARSLSRPIHTPPNCPPPKESLFVV